MSTGKQTLDRFVSRRGELPYAYMLYSELGDLYVGKQRYTDAADTYRAFVDRFPDHERAPLLQMQAIEAYKKGGFAQLVLDGKKEFVERYRLGSSYWAARTPEQFPAVARELKTNLTDLAQYYHAEAQRTKKKPDYHEAARWYREFLQSFPDDPTAPQTNYLLAETLYESEDFRTAAVEYERTAYAYPFHDKSAEAGYAALVAYERESRTLGGNAAAEWNRQRLESQQTLRDDFPRASGERDAPDAHRARVSTTSRTFRTRSKSRASCWRGSRRSTSRCSARRGRSPATRSSIRTVRGCRGRLSPGPVAARAAGSGSGGDHGAARGHDLQAGRDETGRGRCARRHHGLPAGRQARACRRNPRDRRVRRRRLARRPERLAARDQRPGILPQRVSVERAPGRRHAKPCPQLSRRRAPRRSRRRIRAHRGLRRRDAGGAAKRALAGGRALREIGPARPRDGKLRELRQAIPGAAQRGDGGATETRGLREGQRATCSAAASGSTASSSPIAKRAHRGATAAGISRRSRRSSSTNASRDAFQSIPLVAPLQADACRQEGGDGAGARGLPGGHRLCRGGSDDGRDLSRWANSTGGWRRTS